jgi:hypothetical protein
MIPALRDSTPAPHPLYSAFLAELRVRGFAGNLSDAYSRPTVLATDNSIYQMLPQAIMSMTLFASLDWPANRIIEITSKKNGFGCKPVLSRIR